MATKRKIANTTSSPGRVIKEKPRYDEASGSRDVRPFRLEGDIQTKEDIMKVLGNLEVMEHLASFLDVKDLGSLYDTCQTVKDSIDKLQLWRKRAERSHLQENKLYDILDAAKRRLMAHGRFLP